MKYYDIAFEINSELFGGDEFVDAEDVERVRKIIEQRMGAGQVDAIVSVLDEYKERVDESFCKAQEEGNDNLADSYQNIYNAFGRVISHIKAN